ncbi:MAG: GyrI-like domain-containing protein [Saprospiraceae bacterium]|nr:GyrI-like domain-containing protein [Saprospiraceae bacterium]
MNLDAKIEIIEEKKLIGNHQTLSISQYNIMPLWQGFGQRRKEIKNIVSNDLISMSVYKSGYFSNFSPTNSFEKWATVEVFDFDKVPSGMDTFILPKGLYAIFHYKGLNTDHRIFEYIFKTWLPKSKYQLDDRPHFEVLGSKYKNNDPDSEEDIFVPIKPK